MPVPQPVAALIRNLVEERAEAVEQLLVLCQSYAPDRFKDAAKLAEEHRRKGRPAVVLFEEMRGIYRGVVETFAEKARKDLVEGRFDEAQGPRCGDPCGQGHR